MRRDPLGFSSCVECKGFEGLTFYLGVFYLELAH